MYNSIGFPFRFVEEIKMRRRIQQHFSFICEKHGFEEIEIPLICPFKELIGQPPLPLRYEDIFRVFQGTLFYNHKQTRGTVRYEGTTPIASLVSSWGFRRKTSYSYHYFQEMIRLENCDDCNEKKQKAFFQIGLETFSKKYEHHLEKTIDVISVIVELFNFLNLKPKIRFSHVSLVEKNLLRNGFDVIQRKKIVSLLEKKDFVKLHFTLSKMKAPKDVIKSLLEMAKMADVPIDEGRKYLKRLQLNRAYDELQTICTGLVEKGIDKENLRFDAGIHRALNFYSGLIFHIDAEGGVTEVAGGGDFSKLINHFGVKETIHAVGLAASYEKLLHASDIKEHKSSLV